MWTRSGTLHEWFRGFSDSVIHSPVLVYPMSAHPALALRRLCSKQEKGEKNRFTVIQYSGYAPPIHTVSSAPLHSPAPHLYEIKPLFALYSLPLLPCRLPNNGRRSWHKPHRPCLPLPSFPLPLPQRAHLDQLALSTHVANALPPIRCGYRHPRPLLLPWRQGNTGARVLTHVGGEGLRACSSTDGARGAVVGGLCRPLVV